MHVGVVLAERLEAFPFLKIMDPLFLPAQPMVNKKKIKFVCGCGASREVGSIIISKNKAPLHLLLHSVKWSYLYIYIVFYYHKQSLPVGVVLIKRQEVIPFLKIKTLLYD